MVQQKRPVRDLRIDFFRGLALLIIIADHIDLFNGTYFFKASLKWLQPGFSDAAEIFVFLSGYVYGLVYFKYMNNNGFGKMYWKSFNRFVHLYIVNIFVLFVVLALFGWFRCCINPELPFIGGIQHFFENPQYSFIYAAILLYAPSLFNILPLYMSLLLVMPIFLYISKKSLKVTLLVSGLIYLIPLIFSQANLPIYPFNLEQGYPYGSGWSFNPISWQFLFCLGMVISIGLKKKTFKVPKSNILLIISAILFLGAFIPRLTFIFQKLGIIDYHLIGEIPILGKRTLQPGRLLHFFSLVYLVYRFLPTQHKLFNSSWTRPIIWCGQNSLDVFGLGIVLTYLSYFVLQSTKVTMVFSLMLTGVSWLLMIAWGAYLHKKKIVFK